MKTTGILFIVFFVLTCALLVVIPLTASETKWTHENGLSESNQT
jgi:preprotein translocase subunit SecG